MNRKQKIFAGVLVMGTVLLGVGWYLVMPKFGSAPLSELEKLMDPRLLEKPPEVPGGKERWAAFQKVTKELKGTSFNSAVTGGAPASTNVTAEANAYFATNKARLAEVNRILKEGPLQRSWSMLGVDSFPTFAYTKTFAKAARFRATGLAAAGDVSGAVKSLEMPLLMQRRLEESNTSLIEYLVDVAIGSILNVAIADLSMRSSLTEADALKLLSWIPEQGEADTTMRLALLGEFRGGVMTWIDDPKKRLKDLALGGPVFDVPLPGGGVGPGDEEVDRNESFGNYDPHATAKAANAIFLPMILNTEKPASKADHSGEVFQANLGKGLPERPDGEGGWKGDLKERWYRVRMNQISNSFGRMMLADTLGAQEVIDVSNRSRTGRELIRTLLAFHIFEKRFGRVPASIDELVSKGVLQKPPMDYLAEAPLRYDKAKKAIYSVGIDKKDDGGQFVREANPQDPDFGYWLRKR